MSAAWTPCLLPQFPRAHTGRRDLASLHSSLSPLPFPSLWPLLNRPRPNAAKRQWHASDAQWGAGMDLWTCARARVLAQDELSSHSPREEGNERFRHRKEGQLSLPCASRVVWCVLGYCQGTCVSAVSLTLCEAPSVPSLLCRISSLKHTDCWRREELSLKLLFFLSPGWTVDTQILTTWHRLAEES